MLKKMSLFESPWSRSRVYPVSSSIVAVSVKSDWDFSTICDRSPETAIMADIRFPLFMNYRLVVNPHEFNVGTLWVQAKPNSVNATGGATAFYVRDQHRVILHQESTRITVTAFVQNNRSRPMLSVVSTYKNTKASVSSHADSGTIR